MKNEIDHVENTIKKKICLLKNGKEEIEVT